jgi:hypothetical protein
VLDYIHGRANPKPWRYESSRAGLVAEIRDLAISRFGQDYVVPLNNLCARFGESDGYRRMRVSALKKLKLRLKELNRDDPWEINPKSEIPNLSSKDAEKNTKL